MMTWGTPGLWWPANNGHRARRWFLFRYNPDGPTEYHEDSRGYLIRYASYETAQRAADRLNATEATS